jgi:hypothetical protein
MENRGSAELGSSRRAVAQTSCAGDRPSVSTAADPLPPKRRRVVIAAPPVEVHAVGGYGNDGLENGLRVLSALPLVEVVRDLPRVAAAALTRGAAPPLTGRTGLARPSRRVGLERQCTC